MHADIVEQSGKSGIRLAPVAADAALACLAGKALAARFSAWRGASGRRYICTIYPFDRAAPQNGLPPYTDMVVLAVRHDPADGREVAGVARRRRQRLLPCGPHRSQRLRRRMARPPHG